MDREETALLTAVAGGDVRAFEELFRRYHRPVAGFLFKMTGRPSLVEELTNDVMMVVWQKAGTFAGRSKVSTWIMGVAYKKALKAVRRLGRAPQVVEVDPEMALEDPGADAGVSAAERRKKILAALTELPPEQRAVVELTYYFGCSYREIAQIVACPENTVKTRMFHARRKLRSLLAPTRGGYRTFEGRSGSR